MPGVLPADEAGAETQTEHHTMRKNWQKIPLGATVAYNGRQYIYDGMCDDWITLRLRERTGKIRVLGADICFAPCDKVSLRAVDSAH